MTLDVDTRVESLDRCSEQQREQAPHPRRNKINVNAVVSDPSAAALFQILEKGNMKMTWSGNRKAISGALGAALLILALIGVTSYRSTEGLILAEESRQHSYEVMQKFDSLLSLIKDAETGQRGYLITGEEKYLARYYTAVGELDRAKSELRDLTAQDREQDRDLERIEPLLATKLAETTKSDYAVHANLAEYRARLGDAKGALAEIERIPVSARGPLTTRLAIVYELTGHRDLAVDVWFGPT